MNKGLVTFVSRLSALAALVMVNTALPARAEHNCLGCVYQGGQPFCLYPEPAQAGAEFCYASWDYCEVQGSPCVGS